MRKTTNAEQMHLCETRCIADSFFIPLNIMYALVRLHNEIVEYVASDAKEEERVNVFEREWDGKTEASEKFWVAARTHTHPIKLSEAAAPKIVCASILTLVIELPPTQISTEQHVPSNDA